jgi:HK97 family phage prohead protease
MSDKRTVTRGWVEAEGLVDRRDADGGGKALRLSGYAAVFDADSEAMYGWIEQIDARAFDEVLDARPDVRFLADHGGLALARTENGTLRLSTDERGLRFEADLNPEVQAARDLHALVSRGDVTQMSFGFTIAAEDLDSDEKRSRITRVGELFEISAVTFPAYPDTSATAERGVAPADVVDDVVEIPAGLDPVEARYRYL